MHQSHSSSPYTPKRTHNGFYQPRYPEQGHGEATCSPCIKSSEDYVEKTTWNQMRGCIKELWWQLSCRQPCPECKRAPAMHQPPSVLQHPACFPPTSRIPCKQFCILFQRELKTHHRQTSCQTPWSVAHPPLAEG